MTVKHYRVNGFHAPQRGQIDRIDDAVISVSDGIIQAVLPAGDPARDKLDGAQMTDLRHRGTLLPGFVDLHIHAPQFPQLGQALDVPLEVWLQQHTFPLEARFADLDYADQVYHALVRRLLANGTTTALYFATIHTPASLRLAEICLELGQRALVGRVAMDLAETCPDFYRDASAEAAIDDTAAFLEAVPALSGNGGLVKPVITPRFIPSCSDHALQGLGDLAAASGAHIQTHCSESDWEHGHVLDRCGQSDTEALRDFGLLTRHTVLAHGNLISDADMAVIHAAGASVAHCPLSNVFFSNAVFPLRRALEKGVRVGLGTDISGGPSASLMDSARMTVIASRMLEEGVDPTLPGSGRGTADSRVDFRTAFWLATMGGAEALDLPVGAFQPGLQFDAFLVALDDHVMDAAMAAPEGPSAPEGDVLAGDSLAGDALAGNALAGDALLQKIIMLATPGDISATWVAGRQVHGG